MHRPRNCLVRSPVAVVGATMTILTCSLAASCSLSGCSADSKDATPPTPGPAAAVPFEPKPGAGTSEAPAGAVELGTIAGLKPRDFQAHIKDLTSKTDAANDATWDTEVFYDATSGQLKLLGKVFAHPAELTAEKVAPFILDEFECGALRPDCDDAYGDGALIVRRAGIESIGERRRGAPGFAAALADLTEPYRDGKDIRWFFKTIRVEPLENGRVDTTAYFEANGTTRQGFVVQQNATWHLQWQRGAADAPPKLASIKVERYEEILPDKSGGRFFVEVTESVMGGSDAWQRQLTFDDNHWTGQFEASLGVQQANHGIAVADVNGDGLDDVYVPQPPGLPNLLFIHQIDGTAKEVAAEAGLNLLDVTRSVLLLDLDNDGDQDAIIAVSHSVVVFENDGTAKFFQKAIIDTPSRLSSMAAADYDNDGDVDVYVCGYDPITMLGKGDVFSNPVPYEDATNGAPNFMLRNDGDWAFNDVTERIGLNVRNTKFTLTAGFEDYDNDGDQDLYVVNDFGRNVLFRNDGGTFVDITRAAKVDDPGSGMSVSWGDYDRDGRMDLYVANMFSSAGNRIAFRPNFKPGADEETVGTLQRHARGNSLFRSLGGDEFDDVSVEADVTMGRWAWASKFMDLNNDGWEDIYVVNGFYSSEDTGDL